MMHDPKQDDFLGPGEFFGTMGALRAKAKKYNGVMRLMPTATLRDTDRVYVDGAGTIYKKNPDSGKFTIIAGTCMLLAIPMKGTR